MLRPDACVAIQTEITLDAPAAPTVTDTDYELEACGIAIHGRDGVYVTLQGVMSTLRCVQCRLSRGCRRKVQLDPLGAKLKPKGMKWAQARAWLPFLIGGFNITLVCWRPIRHDLPPPPWTASSQMRDTVCVECAEAQRAPARAMRRKTA